MAAYWLRIRLRQDSIYFVLESHVKIYNTPIKIDRFDPKSRINQVRCLVDFLGSFLLAKPSVSVFVLLRPLQQRYQYYDTICVRASCSCVFCYYCLVFLLYACMVCLCSGAAAAGVLVPVGGAV